MSFIYVWGNQAFYCGCLHRIWKLRTLLDGQAQNLTGLCSKIAFRLLESLHRCLCMQWSAKSSLMGQPSMKTVMEDCAHCFPWATCIRASLLGGLFQKLHLTARYLPGMEVPWKGWQFEKKGFSYAVFHKFGLSLDKGDSLQLATFIYGANYF